MCICSLFLVSVLKIFLFFLPSFPVDVRLPFQAEMFIQNVILVFFCVGVISGVFPWFLVAVGPLVVLFMVLHVVSR